MTPSKQATEYFEAILELNPELDILIEKNGQLIFPRDEIKAMTLRKIINGIQNHSNISFFNGRWYEICHNYSDPSLGNVRFITDKTKDMSKKLGIPSRETADTLMISYLKSLRMTSQSFSVVIIDVDNFKSINDTYGHVVGDGVLKAIARLIKSNFRKTDIIGRYGGDEIFLILPNISTENSIKKITDLINKVQSDQTFLLEAPEIDRLPTLSIGAVQVSSGEEKQIVTKTASSELDKKCLELLSLLLISADEALYVSKRNGKNRATIFDANGQIIKEIVPQTVSETVSYRRRRSDVQNV